MTMPVTLVKFPAPLITTEQVDHHVVVFLAANPSGARNSDVGRAIGYNDTRQWFSYGVLERLIRNNKVRKEGKLYFAVSN
jgi:hypothetical protein